MLLYFIVIFTCAKKLPKFAGSNKSDLMRYLSSFCAKQRSESKLLLVVISTIPTLVNSKNNKNLFQFTEHYLRSIGCHDYLLLIITNVTVFETTVMQKMKPYKYRTVQFLIKNFPSNITANDQQQQQMHFTTILKFLAKLQFNSDNRCLSFIIFTENDSVLNQFKKSWLLLLQKYNGKYEKPYLRRFQAILVSNNEHQVVYLKPVLNGCQLYSETFFTPTNSAALEMLKIPSERCNLHQTVLNVTVNNVR